MQHLVAITMVLVTASTALRLLSAHARSHDTDRGD